jgi:hypothetical protein
MKLLCVKNDTVRSIGDQKAVRLILFDELAAFDIVYQDRGTYFHCIEEKLWQLIAHKNTRPPY